MTVLEFIFLTWNGHPKPDSAGMSDTVEYQSNYMLTPKDVLCITATGHRSDFAPEKYITIKNQHISYKKV